MKTRVAILGSTGSIGQQAIEVISNNADKLVLEVITAGRNDELLIEQALKYRPNIVVIADEDKYEKVKNALSATDVKVFAGMSSIEDVAAMDCVDIVLASMVGYAGLMPVLKAIEAGKKIALANKETLVVAGALITKLCEKHKVDIIPVDSEHSALFQCLVGEFIDNVEKLYLTASGGPFRNFSFDELQKVTRKEALMHPNWSMGNKITIDSATMMNKGFEVMEAHWLFGVEPDKIDVLVHPESIIHSMVQFRDGSLKAQLGLPDMRLPIQYALSFPDRFESKFPRADFATIGTLTFEKPDLKKFRCLQLAFDALRKGGNAACILNAANEVVVDAFLNNKIKFLDIPEIIQHTTEKIKFIFDPDIHQLVESDLEAREFTNNLIKK